MVHCPVHSRTSSLIRSNILFNIPTTILIEHKRPSCTSSKVYRHINNDKPEHDVHIDEARILDRDPDWFTRGGREAIYIRAHKPNLNTDGGEIQPSSDLDEAGQVTRHVT